MTAIKKKLILDIFLFLFTSTVLLNSVNATQTYLNESQQWQENFTGVEFSSTAFGDIDNDGDLDLASIGCTWYGAGGCTSYVSKIYINNGTTLRENSTWQQNLTAINYGSVAFGDIDNDGDLDLIMTGCSNGGGTSQICNDGGYQIFIYINNGITLIENLQWQNNLTKSWKGSIALGDIDNDGKLDIALNGQSNGGKFSKIYINNGSSFVENSSWSGNLTAVYESSLAFGDVNNDGNLDIALCGDAGLSDETTKIYINNGITLNENSTWQTNLLGVDWCSLAFGNYDNDEDLDLTLIGHTTQDNHRIYRNNNSTFMELQKELQDLIGIFEGSLTFGDYDNDGDLDLIATGNEGYTTFFIYNDTNFTTSSQDPESHILNLEKGSSLAFGDIDNDGDLDLVLFGFLEPTGLQAKIYTSNCSLTKNNTQPNSPISEFNTTFNFSTGKLTLSWSNGSDTETPTLGLYYNLRVGTCSGCHDVVSGIYGGSSNPTAGYFGNMMQRKSITLNRPDLENKTIYWAVQTIDTGLAKSAWSTEQVYNITQNASQPCTENWSYGEWTACSGGQQTRTATDLNGCGTIVNRSAVVQSCSSTPSGGSPAGSSPPSTAVQNKSSLLENATWYFEKIEEGVDTGFILNETLHAVNQVWVKVKNEANEVYVNIKKLETTLLPQIKEPLGKVYQYLNITFGNLSAEDIDVGKVRFVVSKTWLENNSINKSSINLLRYQNNEWQRLKTTLSSENDNNIYYLAETPGFSIFVIVGELLKEIEMVCVPMGKRCNESEIEECSVDGSEWVVEEVCEYGCEDGRCKEKSSGLGIDLVFIWSAIIVVIVIFIVGIVLHSRHFPTSLM
jgi:PGF-pre-PGF domain-containing protein